MRIQFAATGGDALKLPRTSDRSVWLVNIRLPDGSGCDLAAAIRDRDPRSVVYLVADDYEPGEELEARKVGGAMYVCKPVDPGSLSIAERPPNALPRCA
jgi:DNA-binding response OmpR family regulator